MFPLLCQLYGRLNLTLNANVSGHLTSKERGRQIMHVMAAAFGNIKKLQSVASTRKGTQLEAASQSRPIVR